MSVLGELEDILDKERHLILSAQFEDLERLSTRKSLLAGRIWRKNKADISRIENCARRRPATTHYYNRSHRD